MLNKFSDVTNKMAGRSVLFKLVLYWSSIVGEDNRKILFPLNYNDGILTIAVPNPIVKTYIYRVEKILYAKIASFLNGKIKKIFFTVNPSCFKDISFDVEKERDMLKIDNNEVTALKNDLENSGINSEMSEIFAEIEVLIGKKRNSFPKKRDS